ncbi:ABC transporter permease [Microbacterium sp. NPDC089320]|uniref:ABC transporter permease n=1 Tax=Microbacterium sp. NPDC089320 TaxID=3155182 RepID=UPI00342516F7
MTSVIRSEILRASSGFSVLAVYLVAVLMPAFVLFSDGSRFDLIGVEPGAATIALLQPLAWCAVSAAFVGAYGVTRECYYGSLDRTLTAVGVPRAFAAKLVAGTLVAVVLSICIFVVWTAGVSVILARNGLALALTPAAWQIYSGAMAGVLLGALIGGAIGWITRNYYVTAAIVLVIPMVVEPALLRASPELARFSPGLVLAAISVPGYQGRLLEFAPALGVSMAWAAGLVVVAWLGARKRIG